MLLAGGRALFSGCPDQGIGCTFIFKSSHDRDLLFWSTMGALQIKNVWQEGGREACTVIFLVAA
jgi:hypothetical protein